MKRSEMIKIMVDWGNQAHEVEDDSPEGLITLFLDKVEELGMLPPPVFENDVKGRTYDGSEVTFRGNYWEPENG